MQPNSQERELAQPVDSLAQGRTDTVAYVMTCWHSQFLKGRSADSLRTTFAFDAKSCPRFLDARRGTKCQAILKVGLPRRCARRSDFRPALVPSEADFSWLALQTDEYPTPYIYRVFALFACRSKGVLTLLQGRGRGFDSHQLHINEDRFWSGKSKVCVDFPLQTRRARLG